MNNITCILYKLNEVDTFVSGAVLYLLTLRMRSSALRLRSSSIRVKLFALRVRSSAMRVRLSALRVIIIHITNEIVRIAVEIVRIADEIVVITILIIFLRTEGLRTSFNQDLVSFVQCCVGESGLKDCKHVK